MLSPRLLAVLRAYYRAEQRGGTCSPPGVEAITLPPARCPSPAATPLRTRESPSASPPTRCATALPRICWKMEPTRA